LNSRGRFCFTIHVLVALAIAATAACARSSQASDAAPADDTQVLYDRACAKCHAADGSGGLPSVANGPKPIDLREAAWQQSRSDDDIARAIRDGRGAMPPFADVLTADQVSRLARHVRQLHRR
jgi:mono/diheme cytochrome c family protein